ncbi:MAG: tryptophan-rich sensory protein, partial [Bacteroidetes bacterium]
MPMPQKRTWLGLAGWLLLCYAVAFVASQFEVDAWYAQLQKPPWNPPAWVFGPVWTVLYTLMGIAAWVVWHRSGGIRFARVPLGLFLLQLVLNGLWSALFFG